MTTTTSAQSLPVLDEAGRAALFTEARTSNTFSAEPVTDETLRAVWDLAKWPPTAANTQPLRVVFVRTEEGKRRLLPLLSEGNRAKTEAAPAVAILAADLDFHEFVPRTFPARAEMKDSFEASGREGRAPMAKFNSSLQAGYFLLAARAEGLATGPMAGFDADAVTAEFFPGGREQAILVVNLGHPGENPWFPRLPRLEEEDVVRWA
ncbi:malonic semialdehyde reductase [Pseudonocardia sp. WMMC193]|uniref:malonic semialdehyde reductase n=1 Tax=Pseudonocardia sp. WMMC193 TaxID=2911965 RepID=UPI0035ABF2AA